MRRRRTGKGSGKAWLGLVLSLGPFLFLAIPDLDAPEPERPALLEEEAEIVPSEPHSEEAAVPLRRRDPAAECDTRRDPPEVERPRRTGPRLAGPRSLLELADLEDGLACPPKVALQALRSGQVDAVLVAEPLPPEIWGSDLVHARVGRWAPVLIRHPEQPIRDLTRGQFDHLLRRRIRDWSAVGGPPGRISWRVGGSLDVSFYAGLAQRLGGASRPRHEVLASVREDPSRLGLLGVRALDLGIDERHLVSVDGIQPSRYTIATGSYAPGVTVHAVVRAGPRHSARIAMIHTLLDRSAGLAR